MNSNDLRVCADAIGAEEAKPVMRNPSVSRKDLHGHFESIFMFVAVCAQVAMKERGGHCSSPGGHNRESYMPLVFPCCSALPDYNGRCCTIYRIGVSTFWLRRTIMIMNESFSFAPRRGRAVHRSASYSPANLHMMPVVPQEVKKA
jgi:hypothetical protein